MSFKSTGPKIRPDRVKPPSAPSQETKEAAPKSQSRRSSASSIASFHSARFSPEEETRSLVLSNELKSTANAQFAKQDYSSALSTYDKAVAELPTYLDYELAVLSSNISACYLRLEEWKEALQAAEKGMDKLERVSPMPVPKDEKKGNNKAAALANSTSITDDLDTDDKIVELPSDTPDSSHDEIIAKLNLSDQRKSDVLRIRTKLLLRRARARYLLGTQPPTPTKPDASKPKNDPFSTSSSWSNLSSAQSDYTTLSTPPYFPLLPASDKKTVQIALATLPSLIEKAKEKEVGEMMGKLKDLGNGILKPFGLSTDMFRMEKDEGTGGMSLKFDGGKK